MFAIAVTDLEWFNNVRRSSVKNGVNFWTPTPWGLRQLQPGDRVYFMLKSPIRRIGGFGLFRSYKDMTLGDAWALYGVKNGMPSEERFAQKINDIAIGRAEKFKRSANPRIGCIELNDIECLEDSSFFVPDSVGHKFPSQIVKIKYFAETDRLSARCK